MEDKELIRKEYYVKFAKELMEHIGFDPYARTKGEAFHNFLEMKEREMEQQSTDLPKIDVSKIKYSFVKLWEKRLISTANYRPSAYEREYDEYIDAFLKEYFFEIMEVDYIVKSQSLKVAELESPATLRQ